MAVSINEEYVHNETVTHRKPPIVPNNSFGNNQITPSDPLDTSKTKHLHVGTLKQNHGSPAVAQRQTVHRARAAGVVTDVRAVLSVAIVGDSTITVDVRKNGTTILTGTFNLTSANTAYTGPAAGTLDPTPAAYLAGDVFEAVVTVAANTGTLGQGLLVAVEFKEAAP